MECNKDEAQRAKQIAENKMKSGDFAGALKFAMKAERLFPEIQNIAQIRTVCEVHCAAENKLASEMDWYGILLTPKFTEEALIKKQYKKLALLLHPDKNNSSGAEAAFKFIVEANRVLSDQTKRFLYDTKIRRLVGITAPQAPSHHTHRSYYGGKGDEKNASNHHNNFHSHSHTQKSNQQNERETFWTVCHHCNTKYQYYKTIVNATLHCQRCSKPFKARDIGFQGSPPGHASSSFSSHKVPPNHVPPKEASKSNGGKSFGNGPEDKFVPPCPVSMSKCNAGDGVSPKVRKSKGCHGDAGVTKASAGTSNRASSKAKQSQTPTNVGSKRARQTDSRVDDNDENSNGMKDNHVKENGVDPSGFESGVHSRKSPRKKQHVSYTETAGDCEFERASKRPCQDELFKTTKVDKRDLPGSDCSFSADRVGQNGEMRNKPNAQQKKTSKSDIDDRKAKADNSQPKSNHPPDVIVCPDPDFSDFDKEKAENCFADNQFWAIYDEANCMPRFYARIKKVHSPFNLEYTWLEPNPDNTYEIDWDDAGLPIACGKYKLGHTQKTRDLGMFSHQVHCIKGSVRGSYLIYPMKGETWAIFRHWDIGWSSNPKNHSEYQLDYVEVLSDFDENNGVQIAYLSKVKGFVSLFQKTVQGGDGLFCVPPNELYRFSHRVPSFMMTGNEREDVPKGSFELDPAGLPISVFQVQVGDQGDVKMEDGNVASSFQEPSKCKVDQPKSNGSIHKAKSGESNGPERVPPIIRKTPRSKAKSGESNGSERAPPIIRKSPRSNATNMGKGQASITQYYKVKEDDKNTNHMDYSQPEGNEAAACQTNGNFKTPQKPEKRNYPETSTAQRSPRDLSKKSDVGLAGECATGKLTDDHSKTKNNIKGKSWSVESDHACLKKDSGDLGSCYGFKKEKSREMFQCGQIWAIYGDWDKMPDVYVRIKNIESTTKLRLRVSELEPCTPPKGLKQTVSCGSFKIKNDKLKILSPSAFSHQLKVEPKGNNIYEIYPKKGEIWALYKDQNNELASSKQDKGRGECHIVEVLADSDKSIQVVVLVRLSGSQLVFKTPIIRRSKAGIIEISREEVDRFSHQVLAFQHNGEDDVHPRGCWVVDPSTVHGFHSQTEV